jgi:hypothetical protein
MVFNSETEDACTERDSEIEMLQLEIQFIHNEMTLVRYEVDLIMARIELLELMCMEIEIKFECLTNYIVQIQ